MTQLPPRGTVPAPVYQDDLVTLYRGDCLDLLPALLPGATGLRFGAVVTDPPYGIGWRRGSNLARNSKSHDGILNDEDTSARDSMLALTEPIPAVVFGSFYAPQPLDTRQVLAWRKPPDAGVVGSTTGYRRDVEPIFLVGEWPIRNVEWSSLLVSAGSMAHVVSATGHPHTKPVPLMRDLIGRCPAGVILDPFAGSGSTLVAAKQLGRQAVGIELDEDYIETAVGRLSQEVRCRLEPFPLTARTSWTAPTSSTTSHTSTPGSATAWNTPATRHANARHWLLRRWRGRTRRVGRGWMGPPGCCGRSVRRVATTR